MKHISFYIIAIITTVMALAPASALADDAKSTKVESNRDERNAIRKGNKLFEEKRYAEAEVEYKRALQHNPQSDVANYNLALSYIRQGGSSDPNDSKSPLNQADQILRNVVKTADKGLASRAYYNLGNLAFNKQNYQESVNMYKDALRRNPDDDQARENLRLAQKKLEEQQQDQDKQNAQIKKAVEDINKKAVNSEAIFGIHEATNRVTIKIVDKDTKKVIKELPPEKTLDMIAKVWEMAGLMVDEKR